MISPTSLAGYSNLSGLSSGLGTSSLSPSSLGSTSALTSPSLLSNASTSALGGSGLSGDSGIAGMLVQMMSMLMTIFSTLLQTLQQNSAAQSGQPALDAGGGDASQIASMPTTPPSPSPSPAGNAGGNGGSATVPPELSTSPNPPAAGPAPSPADASQLASGIKNNTTDPTQKQRLDTTLAKVAQDPDGAKLLKAAEANGYSIEVGDPTAAGSQDHDADSVNGVTVPDQKKIVISPNAPDFDKTVVHELVHAATESDGNSQTEEGMADVIGYRVSSRMDGTKEPGTEQQIFENKIKSYPDLQASNSIIPDLQKLGIQP